jgi:hypothetical protein
VVQRVTAQHAPGTLVLVLSDVEDFPVRESRSVPDTRVAACRIRALQRAGDARCSVPDTRLESVAQKAF